MRLQLRVTQTNESLAYGIVKCRAYLTDELTGAIGPRAIGEEHDSDTCIQINPKGAAAVPEVPNGVWREEGSSR